VFHGIEEDAIERIVAVGLLLESNAELRTGQRAHRDGAHESSRSDHEGDPGAVRVHVEPPGHVDTKAPVVTILSGPSGATNDIAGAFTFSVSEATTNQCRIGNGSFSACATSFAYGSLGDGTFTFEVRAVDAAGNVGTVSRSYPNSPVRGFASCETVLTFTAPTTVGNCIFAVTATDPAGNSATATKQFSTYMLY